MWTAIRGRPLAYADITCTCDPPQTADDTYGDEWTCPTCHQPWTYLQPRTRHDRRST